MKVELSKRAPKFLKKLDDSQTQRIKVKIRLLKNITRNTESITFRRAGHKKAQRQLARLFSDSSGQESNNIYRPIQ